MSGYYDYVLGFIPAALIGVTTGLYLAGLSPTVALPGGALAAGAIMAHAMFIRTPVPGAGIGETGSKGNESPTGDSDSVSRLSDGTSPGTRRA
ncbi:hypothetical protein [Halorubrum laminariae]|uniref:Uncharacterized protein n=1 Tax=Halorubrum laminariae TaxID=1433523 RepID=A0ABD6C3G3_9EURY|nr:hypothetical protein [Halorubrum laminariae]